MQSLSFTSLAELFPEEPWRTVFLCIALTGCLIKIIGDAYKIDGLRNDIYQGFNIIFKGIYWCIQAITNEFKRVIACIDPANTVPVKNNTNTFNTWLLMGLFSLYTSYFILLGITTALLTVLKSNNPDNSLMLIAALTFVATLSLAAIYFRGCAHKIARENGINLNPWR